VLYCIYFILEMATFAFKLYIYILTILRFKSIATRRKLALKPVNISDKI